MDETLTTDEPLAPTCAAPGTELRISVDPNGPPHKVAALTAYIAEFDELLSHLAAHPKEQWVAYRGARRIGFGTDDLALRDDCAAQFPDGLFDVFGIDPTLKCSPDETVL